MLKSLILILMGGVLINNYVLNQFLGICPFLGVSKKVNQATGMGVAVIFVMLFATAATWPIYNFVLVPLKIEYFHPGSIPRQRQLSPRRILSVKPG